MANNDVVGNNVLITGGLADGVQIGTKMPSTGIFSSLIATGRTWLTQYTVLGGELTVTMGEGILPTAMGIADATYDFGRPLTVGDYLIIRSIYQTPYEYVQVGALVSGTVYNITRGLGTGGAAAAWPANSVYILLGASGDGRIIMTANGAPRLMVIEQGAAADDAEPRVIVGLLDGITDPVLGALTGWGFWGDKVYITGALNATSGVISGELAIGALGSITVDTDAAKLDANGISLLAGTVYAVNSSLKFVLGVNVYGDVYCLSWAGVTPGHDIRLYSQRVAGESSMVHLMASAPTSLDSVASMAAASGAAGKYMSAVITYNDSPWAANYTITVDNTPIFDVNETGDITTIGDIIMADGATIGQAAGPLMTFDDTNNFLVITGCKVGIGIADPQSPLSVSGTVDLIGGANSNSYIKFKNSSDVVKSAIGSYYNVADVGNLEFITGGSTVTRAIITSTGKFGVKLTIPTAWLHLPACAAGANLASLKIDPGTVPTTPVSGEIYTDGTHIYWVDSGGVQRQLDN